MMKLVGGGTEIYQRGEHKHGHLTTAHHHTHHHASGIEKAYVRIFVEFHSYRPSTKKLDLVIDSTTIKGNHYAGATSNSYPFWDRSNYKPLSLLQDLPKCTHACCSGRYQIKRPCPINPGAWAHPVHHQPYEPPSPAWCSMDALRQGGQRNTLMMVFASGFVPLQPCSLAASAQGVTPGVRLISFSQSSQMDTV